MTFQLDDRVRFIASPVIGGTVTSLGGHLRPRHVGVLWDTGAFGFVQCSRLEHMPMRTEAIPGMTEQERAALSTAYRLAIGAVEAKP